VTTSFDVVGIGNALVDVLSHETDEFVSVMDLNRGTMTLVDSARSDEVYAAMGPGVEISGGSAANTMVGLASFGARVAYLGRVRDDQLGKVFTHDLRATGVHFDSPASSHGPATGRCLIVVTPDAQRTMNTFLGISAEFGPDDVDEELVAAAKVVYLEGYLWDRPEAKEAYRKAARIAHEAGGKVALTLSDPFCVQRHRAEWLPLVEHEVDVLFANEAEIQALYHCDLDGAVEMVAGHCEVAALTHGPRGSLVVADHTVHEIPAEPVEHLADTTGAGDLYASGFLFGFSQRLDLATCGRLGSLAAAEVISHLGARPEVPLAELAAPVLHG